MTTQANEPAAPEAGAAPVPRSARDLGELLWSGWPFGDLAWPFRDVGGPDGAPIRVEEVIDDAQLVIRAELPGVDPEKDLEVTVDDGVLTIKAERRQDKKEKTDRGFRSEFRYGKFVRQVRLPKGTGTEVTADYRDGVLEVRMPKPSSEGTARRIEIGRG